MKIRCLFCIFLIVLFFTACKKNSNYDINHSQTTSNPITTTTENITMNISLTEINTTTFSCQEANLSNDPSKNTFDENDETLLKGQIFAEAYAEMSWNYLHGAAWDDYINIKYFDFNDKSEPNYFEYEGIPFYKLLITDISYNDLITHIKSFFTDEIYEKEIHAIGSFIIGKDNCIYVNGNEPTYIFPRRNERACIISYIKNDDSTITYNCYAKSTETDSEDLYFSFTLNSEGKLCKEIIDSEMRLFSKTYYD